MPMAKITGKGSQTAKPRKIMLIPIAQITCSPMREKEISKLKIRLTRKISISTSQKPLLIRKKLNSFFDLRLLCKKADIPERKTKTGAQKWVIHLVRYKI